MNGAPQQRYAFTFDASSCSGCKACQAACKDRSGLEVGRLWRRVYEISGGGWQADGAAWRTDAFAYNLSIGCNHCEQPICVEVCPTGAMQRGGDGIVTVDAGRCVGCRYCSWACPYGAPQYHAAQGVMSKCDFCRDYLEQGLPPACVAACPLRVLDVVDRAELADESAATRAQSLPAQAEAVKVPAGALGAVVAADLSAGVLPIFPLPDSCLTQPALRIVPPQAARDGRAAARGRLANAEETGDLPGSFAHDDERPLAWFTVLFQAAVGLQLGLFVAGIFWVKDAWFTFDPWNPVVLPVLWFATAIALFSSAGLLASFIHLGRPLRAWRAVANWRRSPLSREIYLAGGFGLNAWLMVLGVWSGLVGQTGYWILSIPMSILGLAALASMASVYRLRTIPAWRQRRPGIDFLLTSLILGELGSGALLAGLIRPAWGVVGAAAGLLTIEVILVWNLRPAVHPGEAGLHFQPMTADQVVQHRNRAMILYVYAIPAAVIAWVAAASPSILLAQLAWLILGITWALAFAGELQRRMAFYLGRRE